MKFHNPFFVTLLSLFLLHQNLYCDHTPFMSLSEWIECETTEILNSDKTDYQNLSENYLARAESYLIAKNYELAFSDFQASYELAALCHSKNNRLLLFQALFGQAIIYGCKGMLDECELTINALIEILNLPCQEKTEVNFNALENTAFLCNFSPDKSTRKHSSKINTHTFFQHTENQTIHGPDRVSVQTCIDFTLGTTKKCRYLISLVPKAEARLLLNVLVDGLEEKAVHCCKTGGVWKSCLQPLVNKWYVWNQKWQALGIPPDPAWE